MAENKVKKKKTASKPEMKPKAVSAAKKTKRAKPSRKNQSSGQTKKRSAVANSGKYGKRFLDEIRKNLLLMRERLLKDISRSVVQQETDRLKFGVGDFYDKASDDREKTLSLTFSERERSRLNQIEDALNRISDGTYGICEMTGEKISEDRLRVMPLARFTIEAQEEMEKVG